MSRKDIDLSDEALERAAAEGERLTDREKGDASRLFSPVLPLATPTSNPVRELLRGQAKNLNDGGRGPALLTSYANLYIAANRLLQFLDAMVGDTDDWPISIIASHRCHQQDLNEYIRCLREALQELTPDQTPLDEKTQD